MSLSNKLKLFKNPKLMNLVKDMTKNHLNNLDVYKQILGEMKTKVKEDVREIKHTFVEVKEALIKRLDRYLEYLKEFMKENNRFLHNDSKESISFQNLLKTSNNMNEIIKYVDFVGEELSTLNKIKESQTFKNLIKKDEDFARDNFNLNSSNFQKGNYKIYNDKKKMYEKDVPSNKSIIKNINKKKIIVQNVDKSFLGNKTKREERKMSIESDRNFNKNKNNKNQNNINNIDSKENSISEEYIFSDGGNSPNHYTSMQDYENLYSEQEIDDYRIIEKPDDHSIENNNNFYEISKNSNSNLLSISSNKSHNFNTINNIQPISFSEMLSTTPQNFHFFSQNYKIDPHNTNTNLLESLLFRFKQFVILDKFGHYIIQNIKNLIKSKIIYKSEINFNKNSNIDGNFLIADPIFQNSKKLFENIQLTILKKEKESRHLSSVIKLVEKFFKFFVRRKDENGNLMFKGVISSDFLTFENYFTNAYKAFEPIDMITIEVFMFKYDLFTDYSEEYDKTNLHRNEMRILLENGEVINNLRRLYEK